MKASLSCVLRVVPESDTVSQSLLSSSINASVVYESGWYLDLLLSATPSGQDELSKGYIRVHCRRSRYEAGAPTQVRLEGMRHPECWDSKARGVKAQGRMSLAAASLGPSLHWMPPS